MFLILSITSSAPSVLGFHGVALELILWSRNWWSPLFASESAEGKSEMKEPFLCVGLLQILGMNLYWNYSGPVEHWYGEGWIQLKPYDS